MSEQSPRRRETTLDAVGQPHAAVRIPGESDPRELVRALEDRGRALDVADLVARE